MSNYDSSFAWDENTTDPNVSLEPLSPIVERIFLKTFTWGTSLYLLAYAAIFCLSLIGNLFVIAVIIRNVCMHITINYFIVNLSIADILMAVAVIPLTVLSNLFYSWELGSLPCKLVPYLQSVAVSTSVNTMAVIAIERYVAICHPWNVELRSQKWLFLLLLVWMYSFIIMTPWFLFYDTRQVNINGSNETHLAEENEEVYFMCKPEFPSQKVELAYTIGVIILLCYVVPLAIILFCYSSICFTVSHRQVQAMPHPSGASNLLDRTRVNVIKMLITVVLFFASSYMPLYVMHLYFLLRPHSDRNVDNEHNRILYDIIFPLCQWLATANCCVNPWIYCTFSHKFRNGFYQLCCGMCRTKETLDEITSPRPYSAMECRYARDKMDEDRGSSTSPFRSTFFRGGSTYLPKLHTEMRSKESKYLLVGIRRTHSTLQPVTSGQLSILKRVEDGNNHSGESANDPSPWIQSSSNPHYLSAPTVRMNGACSTPNEFSAQSLNKIARV